MLDLAKVNKLVAKAANAAIPGWAGVKQVDSARAADEWGDEFLDITITLKKGSFQPIRQHGAFDILVRVADALRAAKEERSPVLSYVTEEELEQPDDDPEP